MYTKRFPTILVLLAAFMILSMGANSCGCGNPNQAKPKSINKDSLTMEVTPTTLEGDQRRITVTFIPAAHGSSKHYLSVVPYQLQASFPGNVQVYYTSSKQVDQVVQHQEKVKLERLLSTQQINTPQAITLAIVPGLGLGSLEMELSLLDAENQVVQKSLVRWKQDKSLSTIRIELGHNQASGKVIYALDNEGEGAWKGIKLRYTNTSGDEEGKKALLDNQLTSILPIPALGGGARTENQFINIDFKGAQKARFKFEVIDAQNQVLATREEVFDKDAPDASAHNNRAFQEIVQELKKAKEDIDMNKVKRLLDEPGVPINKLTSEQDDEYVYPLTMVSRAAQEGNLEIVKLLIGKGADVEARAPGGTSALEMAARKGDQDMVRALLEAGANINGSPTNGFAPVNLASRYGNVAMLQELLKSDQLDINKQDSSGKIALHSLISAIGRSAAENNQEKKQALLGIMKEMINKGADVNKQTFPAFERSPLHLTICYPSEAFELLLNAPTIQVDVQDGEGCTPLHELVYSYLGEKDSGVLSSISQKISLLLQHGARIDLKSKPWEEIGKIHSSADGYSKRRKENAGKSVREIAIEAGDAHLIQLLKAV